MRLFDLFWERPGAVEVMASWQQQLQQLTAHQTRLQNDQQGFTLPR